MCGDTATWTPKSSGPQFTELPEPLVLTPLVYRPQSPHTYIHLVASLLFYCSWTVLNMQCWKLSQLVSSTQQKNILYYKQNYHFINKLHIISTIIRCSCCVFLCITRLTIRGIFSDWQSHITALFRAENRLIKFGILQSGHQLHVLNLGLLSY